MAVNQGQAQPPLQSQTFTDNSGRLTAIGLSTLQSMLLAIQKLQAIIGALPTPASPSYADDAAAAAGGIAVGGYYRNGSFIQMRIV